MSAIQDAYNQIGADFSDVLRRFTSEKLIVRFAEKFLEDGQLRAAGRSASKRATRMLRSLPPTR